MIVILFVPSCIFSQIDTERKKEIQSSEVINSKIEDSKYYFIENKGQWDSNVLYMAVGKSLRTWITRNSIVFEQFEKPAKNSVLNTIQKYKAHAIALEFINPSKMVTSLGKIEEQTKFNFMIGNDKSRYTSGVKRYKEVKIDNIYDGINMQYYFENGELRYDFIVQPYANPNLIEFEIKGSNGNILENSELVMKTSLSTITQKGLFAYQTNKTNLTTKEKVTSEFLLNGNRLKYLIGNYDKSRELIIDPLTLIYSKIINSQNSNESIYDLKNDNQNNILFCGATNSINFPATLGTYSGATDIIVGKIDETLSTISWITFIGGSGHESATSLDLYENNIYFTGETSSSDFPLNNELSLNFSGSISNYAFVLNNNGNDLPLFSTYLGNKLTSWSGTLIESRIKLSQNGEIVLTGKINDEVNFPFYEYKQLTEQTHPTTCGFIICLETNGLFTYNIKFSSKFSGIIRGLDIDELDNIYITGITNSNANSFHPTNNSYKTNINSSSYHIFITKLQFDATLNRLKIDYNTYFGGPTTGNMGFGSRDIVYYSNKIYFCGLYDNSNLPLINPFDSDFDRNQNINPHEGFLAVLSPNSDGINDLIYSSYFGGLERSSIHGLTYDSICNKIIFAGTTSSELDNYIGSLTDPFSNIIKIMVGVVDINQSTTGTLVDLAYIGGYNSFGTSICHNPSNNRIYTGGWVQDIFNEVEMGIYSLSKNYCDPVPPCACPPDANGWLTITASKGADGCAPNECKITHRLHIPEMYQCYEYIRITSDVDNNEIWDNTLVEFQNFNITDFNLCIPEGGIYTLKLKFYRSLSDNEPCEVKQTVYCNIVSVTEPCTKDCESIEWKKEDPLIFDIDDCPGCTIIVTYWTRKACGFQDIQVTSIEKKSAMIMPICCTLTNEQLFIETIRRIIKENRMGFDPKTSDDPCSDIYRVSQATCWASWTVFINDGVNPPRAYFITKPCNNECCSRKLRVCRNADNSIDIFDLGPGEIQSSCENVTLTLPTQVINCYNRCSSLENIANNPPFGVLKSVHDNDINISKKEFDVSSTPVIINIKNNIMNINFYILNEGKLKIQIYDLIGNLVKYDIFTIIPGVNSFDIDLSSITTGLYFYQVSLDGIQIFTDKMIFVR